MTEPSSRRARRDAEPLDRRALQSYQLERLNALLDAILPENRFYARKLAGCPLPLTSLDELSDLPMTTKEELLGHGADARRAANRTFSRDRYVRLHRTSGTHGRPMVVLDTAEDWQWWIDCWQAVLDAAGIGSDDRALLAFSFGPFIGFWSACDALLARGTLVVSGGGMNTLARLELLETTEATALFGTPSYALHMAEVAARRGMCLGDMPVRSVVVAGEPGGSIRATRRRIEEAYGARVIDHAGATEVGPWGCGDPDGTGLHVLENEFIAEFLSVETGRPATAGELAHLVLTSLGRVGSPAIRYRTGDVVRPVWPTDPQRGFVRLEGGVLGRSDNMMIVRGVNIFPSSIEQIVHGFPEVAEYRMTVSRTGQVDTMRVDVEDRLDDPDRIAEELQLRLGMKVDVRSVPPGTLPRFETKGKRFIDERPPAV